MALRGDADSRRALATAAEGAVPSQAKGRVSAGRWLEECWAEWHNKVATRDSAPEMESHAKALPAPS